MAVKPGALQAKLLVVELVVEVVTGAVLSLV
jgi:hypothetical protein